MPCFMEFQPRCSCELILFKACGEVAELRLQRFSGRYYSNDKEKNMGRTWGVMAYMADEAMKEHNVVERKEKQKL